MKRTLAFMLALVLVLSCIPVVPAAAQEQYFTYRTLGDGTLEITGYSGPSGAVSIPSYIDGRKVSGIGECAFQGDNITSIYIPETVISISTQPFVFQENLTMITVDPKNEVFYSDAYGVVYTKSDNGQDYQELVVAPALSGTYTVPDGVGYIRPHAFEYYNNLEKLVLGKNVKVIGSYAFEGCRNLKEVTFAGKMVTTIQTSAFAGCTNLETITLPEGLLTIGDHAFSGCKSLQSMAIPASVTSVGVGAFNDTDSLSAIKIRTGNQYYKSASGVLVTVDGVLHSAPGGISGQYKVSSGITEIGDFAFYGCDKLTGITFVTSVTKIGTSAFQFCTGLTEVAVSSSVKEISERAFYHCENLSRLRIWKGVETIGESAFDGCEKLTHVAFPSTLTYMGKWAFYNCPNLKTMSFRSQKTEFDPQALAGSSEITAYHYKTWTADMLQGYGGNVTWVAVRGAGDCGTYMDWTLESNGTMTIHGGGDMTSCAWTKYNPEVTNLVLDGKISSIYDAAFQGCKITQVILPESVTKIGANAFADTTLTDIEFLGEAPTIAENAFQNVTANAWYSPVYTSWDETTCLNYGGNLTWRHKTLTGVYGENATWHLSADGTLTISGTGDFTWFENGFGFENYKDQINKIVVEEGITSVFGFDGCVNLTEVQFPESLLTIEFAAFRDCSSLAQLDLPKNLKAIGDSSFAGCTSLKTVVLPDSVTSVSIGAFSDCISLTDVYLSKNLDTLWLAFYGCYNLNSVRAAEDSNWFNDDQGVLYKISGDDVKVYVIPPKLTGTLYIPDGVTGIDSGALICMDGITELSLPDTMGEGLFYNIEEIMWSRPENQMLTLTFRDNAPPFFVGCFDDMTLTVRYPVYNKTWDSVKNKNYGGNITWESYNDSFAYGTCGDLNWVLKHDGHMIITGTGEMVPYGIPVIAYAKLLKKLTIKEGITVICADAFENCANLTEVTLPNSLVAIDSGAFRNCSGIQELNIPQNVVAIGAEAFSGCVGLTMLDFNQLQMPVMGENVLFGVTAVCRYPAEIESWLPVINEKFGGEPQWKPFYLVDHEECGFGVFATMTHDGKLTISGTGEMHDFEIQYTAPWEKYRSMVRKVVIEEGVTYIGSCAFTQCINLVEVKLPQSLETIMYDSFNSCESLETITIPSGVTQLYSWSFSYCIGLKEIYFEGDAPNMEQDIFDGLTLTVYYPQNAAGWTEELRQSLGNNITWKEIRPTEGSCGENATWKLQDGVLTISGTGEMTNYMIYDKLPWYPMRKDIQKIVVEEGITALCISAFYGCNNVTEVILPDGLTKIHTGLFFECTSLETVNIPDTVTYIGSEAFIMCESLKTVKMPESLEKMGNFVFGDCVNLADITFPDKGFEVGVSVFSDTAWFKAQPDGVVYAGKTAISKNLGPVTILKPGTEVLAAGFTATELILPVSVKQVNAYAFNVTQVYFTGSAPSFGTIYTGSTMTAYYPANDTSWTEDARPDFDGQVTWVGYEEQAQVGDTVYPSFAQAVAACEEGQYVKLLSNAKALVTLERDLYVDLNGFDLSGVLEPNGYKIYGMDSTTDEYSSANAGVFSCSTASGAAVVPEVHVKTSVGGAIRRYMTICESDGYTFHRFYIGVVSQSVRPKTMGVGFKAVIYGDEQVMSAVTAYGFTMQLGTYTPKAIKKNSEDLISGKEMSLLINNYDVENYGETRLEASVMIQLTDGTVIESDACSMTMRSMMETLDGCCDRYSSLQLQLVREMLAQFKIVKNWNLPHLLGQEEAA